MNLLILLIVIGIGISIVRRLPNNNCNQDCNQGRNCDCGSK